MVSNDLSAHLSRKIFFSLPLKTENSSAMNIQTRKYKIIEQVMNLSEN